MCAKLHRLVADRRADLPVRDFSSKEALVRKGVTFKGQTMFIWQGFGAPSSMLSTSG